jgi:hypothetical protein
MPLTIVINHLDKNYKNMKKCIISEADIKEKSFSS